MLSDLERDALAELGNIGIGRASTALGRMLGGLVTLSVPTVDMVPPDTVAGLLDRVLTPPLVGISETLDGLFAGCALLVFPRPAAWPWCVPPCRPTFLPRMCRNWRTRCWRSSATSF